MFRAAKHPANNRAVQRLLIRASYLQASEYAYRSMLDGAGILAALTVPASSVGGSIPSSSQATSSVILRPRVIRGIGEGTCRIVNENPNRAPTTSPIMHSGVDESTCMEAGAEPQAPMPTDADTPSKAVQPPPRTGLGSSRIAYDEVCHIRDAVHAILDNVFQPAGKVLLSTVGAHRRGAPFVGAVELLVAHTDVHAPAALMGTNATASMDPLSQFAQRAVRALQQATAATAVGDAAVMTCAWDYRDSMQDAPPHIRGASVSCALRWTAPVPVEHGRLPSQHRVHRLVKIRWTTSDRYVPQLLLLTGPECFVANLRQHAALAHGIELSMQGAFVSKQQTPPTCSKGGGANLPLQLDVGATNPRPSVCSHRRMLLATEPSLFAHLRLPYVHPFNRG